MNRYGYLKVAAAVPQLRVADCDYNAEAILQMMRSATQQGVRVILFPELSLTSVSCGDLIMQPTLLGAAEQSLKYIVEQSKTLPIVAIIGVPVGVDGGLYNCAAVVAQGHIVAIIPKSYIPSNGDMAQSRWFRSGLNIASRDILFAEESVPFGCDLLFSVDDVACGVEIGSDLWAPIPPSSYQAMAGAKIIFNTSAMAQGVGSDEYTQALVCQHSARSISAYVYTSAGYGESSTDMLFTGNPIIAENGVILRQGEPLQKEEQMIIADVDIQLLEQERRQSSISTTDSADGYFNIAVNIAPAIKVSFDRDIDPMPFVPADKEICEKRCKQIFATQSLSLAKRLEHTHCKSAVIGISGGLDSTLALLVTVDAFDRLGLDRKGIVGVTMPGFGTTDRTYNNAITLIKELGVTLREIPIAAACRQHFADIGLKENDRSVAYENAQARERTQILMDVANIYGGMVVGTGDLSELALGWATYNGDQMSMYGVNASIPKTLVRCLVEWVAFHQSNKAVAVALTDVVATPVSPELLPADERGDIAQKTEDLVGPYELHDFFIYNSLRRGFSPAKILFLAEQAFSNKYDRATILKWMKTFFRRFFAQQFKRSAMPDGPKVGSVSLSPRGGWMMPSDAMASVWLKECDNL